MLKIRKFYVKGLSWNIMMPQSNCVTTRYFTNCCHQSSNKNLETHNPQENITQRRNRNITHDMIIKLWYKCRTWCHRLRAWEHYPITSIIINIIWRHITTFLSAWIYDMTSHYTLYTILFFLKAQIVVAVVSYSRSIIARVACQKVFFRRWKK